jgi:uncharacterized protein
MSASHGHPPELDETYDALRQILTSIKTIAVVGLSDKPDRPAHHIPAYLQSEGYRIIPVNPTLTEVLGEKAYPDLRSVPVPVDVVQVFRRAEDVPAIVEDAIAIQAPIIWMQSGVVNEDAATRAEAAGMVVVMDICMGATHRYLRSLGAL